MRLRRQARPALQHTVLQAALASALARAPAGTAAVPEPGGLVPAVQVCVDAVSEVLSLVREAGTLACFHTKLIWGQMACAANANLYIARCTLCCAAWPSDAKQRRSGTPLRGAPQAMERIIAWSPTERHPIPRASNSRVCRAALSAVHGAGAAVQERCLAWARALL